MRRRTWMRIGRRPASGLTLGVSAALLAGTASAAAATVPGGAAQAAATVPGPGYTSQLAAVTCARGGGCWAVGSYQTQSGASRNEVFGWHGHGWVRVGVPQPGGQAGLNAVSCPSAGDCLAVGFTSGSGGHRGGAEVLRWDGTAWSVASAPAGVTGLQVLSCARSGRCWAVDTENSLAVPWNGRRWGTPVRFSAFDAVNSLSCLSATNCWAAGFYVKPNQINLYNLVMHWNGQAWSQVKAPQPPGADQLNAIGCLSATSCWAGGSKEKGGGIHTTNELLRWAGHRWVEVPQPRGPQINSEVLGLQCRVPGDCWAVGDDNNGSTEALHWNGSQWARVRTPDPGGAGFLFGVSCLRADDCLAVGFSHFPPVRNLALRWDGTRWAAV